MQRLSAAEAIGPAWERTKDILARPWKLGKYLKLAFAALLAEVGSFFSIPNFSSSFRNHGTGVPSGTQVAAFAAVSALVMLIFFIVGVILFYFGSRMQLVMVDVVATRQTTLRPLWDKSASPAWRWMGLKALLSIPLGIAVLIASLGSAFVAFRNLRTGTPGQLPPGFFAAFFAVALVMGIIFLVFFIVYWFLRDFALPVIALENAPLKVALGRAFSLLKAEPGELVLYIIVRLLLFLVCAIVGYITYILVAIVGAIPLGLVGALLYFALHNTALAPVFAVIGTVLAVIVLAIWILLAMVLVSGWIFTFFQAFALYFYGGRYPLLGDLLEPPGQSWWTAGYGMMTPPIEPPRME